MTGAGSEAEPDEKALSVEAFFSTYLPAMLLALGVGIALPAIPVLAKSFDVGFGLASLVVTAFLVGGVLGTVPTGWLIDRFGRRPIMVAGPLLTAAMALLTALAQSFPELLVYRFVDGWAAQMWLLARLAGISHRSSAGQRGRHVTWMYSMDNVGRLSGPLVGGLLAATLGQRSPFVAYAALALVALIPTIKLTPEVPIRRGVLAPGGDIRPLRVAEIVLPRLAIFGVAFFSAMARGPIYANMLHLYAAFAYNLDAAGIGVLATSASAMGIPIGFLAGWLMDRFGRKVTMVPGFASVTLTMLLLAVTAFLQLSLVWYVVTFLAAVASQSLTGGSVQTVGADVAPPQARGLFLGLFRFTGQLGSTISPIVFGVLAERTGYGSSFIFVALAGGITALLLITVIPETRRLGWGE
ncbi:MAG TPA: MFS transporter [Chloroflexota bacterium]|nr:MFS transporter [Chloroflexota bacterium]